MNKKTYHLKKAAKKVSAQLELLSPNLVARRKDGRVDRMTDAPQLCTKCKSVKMPSEFRKATSGALKGVTLKSHCKSCEKEASRQRYLALKAAQK